MKPFDVFHSLVLSEKNVEFKAAVLEETAECIVNPSRGWYEIYSFNIDEKPDFDELIWCLRENQSIVLVLINLAAARENILSEEQLANADNILDFFRRAKKDIILRFAYDTEGKGLKYEPDNMQIIFTHMKQFSYIIRKYKSDIFVMQGLLIGSWGEMHTSSYASPQSIKRLAKTFRNAVGDDIVIAVRRPVQLRYITTYKEFKKGLSVNEGFNLGLFNDGIFGSKDHLGTYGISKRNDRNWEEAWIIEDEMEFIDKLCNVVPNGGEAVLGVGITDCFNPLETLNKMHTSYLNCAHDKNILDIWKSKKITGDGIWNGETLYNYIGEHLGYRIVIRRADVKIKSSNQAAVTVEFENIGFAALYDRAEFGITLINKKFITDGKNNLLPENIIKKDFSGALLPGKKYTFKINIPVREGELYLSLQRKKDGKYIKFATKSVCEGALNDNDRLLYVGQFFNCDYS